MLLANIKLNFHYVHVRSCSILFLVSRYFFHLFCNDVVEEEWIQSLIIHVHNPFLVMRILEMLQLNHVLNMLVHL